MNCVVRINYTRIFIFQGFFQVNHSVNFKDPETGAHTNAIESSWRAAKASLSSSGRVKAHLPGNLARYMFFKKCKEQGIDRCVEFFRLAGQLYNGLETTDDVHGDEEVEMYEEEGFI
ncbi:MAG TPA: hypothetical protein VEP90_00865 [Methylomirabilota bacterium]|nr:hypothetical protein [Methylomirabilota bacterium]